MCVTGSRFCKTKFSMSVSLAHTIYSIYVHVSVCGFIRKRKTQKDA